MQYVAEHSDNYRDLFRTFSGEKTSAHWLNSGDEGAGIAHVVLLGKPTKLPDASVLALLWSRLFVFVEEWDDDAGQTIEDIWEYALGGDYMACEFRRFVDHASFHAADTNKARERIQGSLFQVKFDYFSNKKKEFRKFNMRSRGEQLSFDELGDILMTDYLRAFHLTDEWNDISYFFESADYFGYFSWGTSA